MVDLPGIYSLSPYTSEEIVTRDFLIHSHPDGIINIVDATNIERNLYLSLQLMELNIPMVIALNMMDEVRANGGTIKIRKMQEALGVPVVPISASKNEGDCRADRDSLCGRPYSRQIAKATWTFVPGRYTVPSTPVAHLVEDHAERIETFRPGLPPPSWWKGDEIILQALATSRKTRWIWWSTAVTEMEQELGTDREAALADMRYTFIERRVRRIGCKRPRKQGTCLRSVKIDSVLTHKYLAIPIFLGYHDADFLADLWRDRPGSQRSGFLQGIDVDNQFNQRSRPDCLRY